MSSIIKKRKKKDKYSLSKSDIDFYRMTGVFALVCIFVLLAVNMQGSVMENVASGNNLTYNFYQFCRTPWFWIFGTVMAVGAVVWFAYCKVKKVDESKRIFTSTNCLSVVAYFAFFCLCFGVKTPSGNHTFFIAVTIGAALLYYASRFYGMDFVVYSTVTAVMAMTVSTIGLFFDAYAIVIKIAVIAALCALCVLFNKKIDSLKVSKHKKASFLKFPMYISLALGTVFLFWAITPFQKECWLFLRTTTMLMILLLQYVVFAVVYTIRRIKD